MSNAEVTTTRPIDMMQLARELADPPAPLSLVDGEDERTVTCHDDAITQAMLEAAVAAHVPAEPPPSAATLLQAQVDELTDLMFQLMEGLM